MVKFLPVSLSHQDEPIHIISLVVFEVNFFKPRILNLYDTTLSVIVVVLQDFRDLTYLEHGQLVVGVDKVLRFEFGHF